MNDKALFHWIDYVIFVTSLIIGAAIGIYYGCFNKSQNSVEGLLMGNRKLGVLPVALSIQATFVSAIIILGGPSEVYSYGTMIFMWILSDVISIPLLIFIFVPYFRSNPKTVSVYQVQTNLHHIYTQIVIISHIIIVLPLLFTVYTFTMCVHNYVRLYSFYTCIRACRTYEWCYICVHMHVYENKCILL